MKFARRSAAAILSLVWLLTSGCGGPEDRAAPLAQAAPEPSRGGTLRIVQEACRTLDPSVSSSTYEALAIGQIFDALVEIGPGLHVVPGLADTWTISDDARTYTFHLRPGVRFHDGVELTADDVVFSFRRVLNPASKERSFAASYLSAVRGAMDYLEGRRSDLPGIEAPDPRTVRIHLDQPYLSFLDVLAMESLRIVPRHIVEKIGDEKFGRAPVGTGPFRLQSWDLSGIHLVANADYFRGAPYLDAVEILARGEDEEDFGKGRFDRGEADVFDVSSDNLALVGSDPSLQVCRFSELSLTYLGLMTRLPALRDVRVRLAIAHAIDREAVAKQSAIRRISAGILPPGMPGYSPSRKALPFDPERARELLREAGYPDGAGLDPLHIVVMTGSETSVRLVEKVRSDLAAVGIPAEVVSTSWTDLSNRIDQRKAPTFILGWTADVNDPDTFLRALFVSGGAANFFEFEDATSDALLETGARELNPVERARIYREAEQRILELAPMVPLFHTIGLLAVRNGVHGIQPGPLGQGKLELEKAWMEAGEEGG